MSAKGSQRFQVRCMNVTGSRLMSMRVSWTIRPGYCRNTCTAISADDRAMSQPEVRDRPSSSEDVSASGSGSTTSEGGAGRVGGGAVWAARTKTDSAVSSPNPAISGTGTSVGTSVVRMSYARPNRPTTRATT